MNPKLTNSWYAGLVFLFASLACSTHAQADDSVFSQDGKQVVFQKQGADGPEYWIHNFKSTESFLAFDTKTVKNNLQVDFGLKDSTIQLIALVDSKPIIRYGQSRYFSISRESEIDEILEEKLTAIIPPRLYKRKSSSQSRTDPANMEVVNKTTEDYTIRWINTNGRGQDYGTIKAGETFSISTYRNHVWELKSNGKPKVYFAVSSANDRILVDSHALKNARNAPALNTAQSASRLRPAFRNNSRRNGKDASVFVREHNLFLKLDDIEKPIQLTQDATQQNSFQKYGSGTRWFNLDEETANQGHTFWSPSGKHLIALQTQQPPEPRVYYLDSTPNERRGGNPNASPQPELKSYQYPKPGDPLPINRPRLFSVDNKSEIPVDNSLFDNPFSLRFLGWSDNEDRFWLHYNQRGHQVVRILEVSVTTGEVRPLIEETSETFIHYSDRGKSAFGRLGANELLWASERSGWNHLYVYQQDSGKVVRQLTDGDWNVKRIYSVDYDEKVIWFYAVGVHKNQDPYHEHFCRVNFDGSDFRVLTESDGTHEVISLESDLLMVSYSRIDKSPVTEARNAMTGDLLFVLGNTDAAVLPNDRKLTTRFKAKGRDGETDIWGIIHWPKDFDPSKKYPVVENIYAGPHDHHVPKKFRTRFSHQHAIADSGKIVVQIDGMGTAWRSKAFHDVCFQNLSDGGFPDRIAWLRAAAQKYPQMDLERVGIYGGSAGGQNAMAALLWHHDFYSVAVADCGCHDNRMDKIWWNEQWMGWPLGEHYAANSNMENAGLLQGNLMLTLGELDRNVDPASTRQVVKRLIDTQKDFEFVLVVGKGHGAGESPWASKKRLEFLNKHLGPPQPRE